jgi:acetoin utilization deacetylase AcuC-like enzyme
MAGDPLADFTLEPGHYAEWTRRLRDRFPAAGMLSVLEGGYLPERLADGTLAHLGGA